MYGFYIEYLINSKYCVKRRIVVRQRYAIRYLFFFFTRTFIWTPNRSEAGFRMRRGFKCGDGYCETNFMKWCDGKIDCPNDDADEVRDASWLLR